MSSSDITQPGIYRIVCRATGKRYVGTSGNILMRMAQHCAALRAGCHPNESMQLDWKQYGGDAFSFEIIEVITDRQERYRREAAMLRDASLTATLYNPFVPCASQRKTYAERHSEIAAPAVLTDEELVQVVTPTEAAQLKHMSLNLFKYHIQKPGAPAPILIGVYKHEYYNIGDIERWTPDRVKVNSCPPAYAEGVEPRISARTRSKGKEAK